MGKRRRKDEAHDVGDSMPGTVGDSQGTMHDQQGSPSFDPEDVTVPGEKASQQEKEETESESSNENDRGLTMESGDSTRMRYAKKYGDSWPQSRQERFLREHDVSAAEMGWKVTE
jgi:hypothetical protein